MSILRFSDRKTCFCVLLAGLFSFIPGLVHADSGNPYQSIETYKALAEALEKNPPAPVSLTEPLNGVLPVDQSLQELRGQLKSLTAYLKNSGRIGQKWSAILHLPELTAETNKKSPDIAKLEEYLAPFRSHIWGLEVEVLQNAGVCLQDYIGLRILIEDKVDLAESLQSVLPDLIKTLKQADSGSFQSAAELNAFLMWAKQYRQLSDVCAQIRYLACRNNLSIAVSEKTIQRYASQPVNRTVAIQETIQGVQQRGTMKMLGTNQFELIPNADKIGLRLTLDATGTGATTGYAERGVRITSNATNIIKATKEIYFDGTTFSLTPTVANVTVNSKVTGLNAPSPVVQRAAQNRISESRAAANREATQKAQARTRANLDREITQLTQQATKNLRDFSLLYKERGVYPNPFKCSSFEDHVLIEGFTQRYFALCSQPRPEFSGEYDIRVSVHQSMPTEFAKGLLADLRANEKTFLTIAQSMLPPPAFAKFKESYEERRKKNQTENNEELSQGYLYFNANYPLMVEFKDGKAFFALRVDAFQGDLTKKTQDIPMNISACYKPELGRDEQGRSVIRFVLQDKVEFVPRDFETQRRSMTKQETTLRNRMGDEIGKIFPKDFVLDASDMLVKKNPQDKKATEKVGTLVPVAIDIKNGWLQIGWQIVD